MAKGIRINQLAKDLGVESKAILAKCRDEGLGEKVANHMSVVSIGLAETIREWFSGHDTGGGTAVETAPPVEVATKPKTSRARSKKKVETVEDGEDNGSASDDARTAVADAPVAEPQSPSPGPAPAAEAPVTPPPARPAPARAAPVRSAPARPIPTVEAPVHRETPQVATPPAGETLEEPNIAASAPAPSAPAPMTPSAPGKSGGPGGVVHDLNRPPQLRETITLANRPGVAPAVRKPVTPAPALRTPAPATIQGPNVVRVEKPEIVSAPRPRRPVGGDGPGPGFTTARPGVGRGVKPTDDDEEEKKKAAAKKGGASLSARRRGADGRRGEAMEKLREFTDADLIERRDRLNAATASRAAFEGHLKKSEHRGHHVLAKTGVQRGEPIEIEEPITVKSLSAALGIKTNDILKKLMQQGVFANVNQSLDADAAAAIALDYGIELHVAQQATMEEELMAEFEARNAERADQRVPRPAVVTILGHVDHGKTSLLDKIRSANVAAGEAGGITQHTAAWQVVVGEGENKKQVTFIDTPGHQAFTSMRARGANMTDVVVLVVAAVEGVMPQTVESINHARAAGVPIVVALNKIDRPEANPDMVLGQLAQNGLNPVEWGGDTEVIRTSAITGKGIKELIEILDYQSQLLELKADPTAPARGAVIESRVDPGLGAVATVLVQDGTLRVGDVILSGPGYGRIRSLINDRGENIPEAPPSTPVIVSGLNILPGSGDKFFVLDDFERARSIAEERATMSRQNVLSQQTKVTLDNLFDTMKAGDVKTINLIIKGDVQGSVETLAKTVTDQNTDEVKIRVIHSAVGGITESDVELADASNAVIIGFHVVPDEAARHMAEQRRVEIRLYRVIYEIFDDLKKALSGLLEPEVREKLHGHVEVRQVFKVSKLGNIAGCFVTDGHIQRGSKIRLIRDGRVVTEDLAIETLRRVKDDVKEVKSGFECGIKLANYDDVKVGDRYEAYIRETFQRTL
ncbi:MAG TPA: translation initiation factor IF-2 [Tepidisphaeraceae bacterium]|nr:translation initiation factor IF-2 [Tepidisphaeraceae bacterium]